MKERSFEQILEEMNDSVNKPNHYCGEYGLESIDVIMNRSDSMRDYTRNQMDHFRQQLQLLILGKGLTRKELSRKLNRNPNTIQQWITNKNIKPAHVQELCKFFNINEKALMGDPEELTDYRFFDQGKYICTAPIKELSKITGKDVSILKYYIHLNERGREAGQFRLERVIEDEK